eukprot:scaffold260572_cov35-Tisochrysis_lutea.AAC.1
MGCGVALPVVSTHAISEVSALLQRTVSGRSSGSAALGVLAAHAPTERGALSPHESSRSERPTRRIEDGGRERAG